MGLRAYIYKHGDYDCTNGGISTKYDEVCIVNVEGPFEPDEKRPAVMLCKGPVESLNIVPVALVELGKWTMMGGNYVATSDSRFSEACAKLLGHRFYGAVPLHDLVE
jgi:hypothetical protein